MTHTYEGFQKNKLKDLPMKINNLSKFKDKKEEEIYI